MNIRAAKETDLDAASQLWFERAALLRESDASMAFAPDAIHAWRKCAKGWIADAGYAFFVGDCAGELAGFVVASTEENSSWLHPPRLGEIVALVLDLHRSPSGLGGALLERAVVWLRAHGLNAVEVQTPASYPVEEAFWRGQGAKLRSHRFRLQI